MSKKRRQYELELYDNNHYSLADMIRLRSMHKKLNISAIQFLKIIIDDINNKNKIRAIHKLGNTSAGNRTVLYGNNIINFIENEIQK